MLNLNVIKYIAEEVERQGDGPIHVAYMCEAWEWVMDELNKRISKDAYYVEAVDCVINFLAPETIMKIGSMVEPNNNKPDSFRHINVRVGENVKMHHSLVPRAMENLFSHDALTHMTPEEVYFEFEDKIHPFRDGNGRTGKVIYNCLKGTMDKPIMPPNFWNTLNP